MQGSNEWSRERLGKVTASRVADVVATTKSGPAASRQNYLSELVCERLTGEPLEQFVSDAMERGSETEPVARLTYEFMNSTEVTIVDFVPHPKIAMSGASPDGLVGKDGLVEIKCPSLKTHIATLSGGPIDGRYVKQMQWQMACTGRKWCDFVSFDPRFPAEMQLHVTRVHRDDETIAALELAVRLFLKEVDATVEKLRGLYQQREAA